MRKGYQGVGFTFSTLCRGLFKLYFAYVFSQFKSSLVRDFSQLALPRFEDGTFQPIVQKILPLSDIAKAHTLMEANKTLGKIVLKVHEDDTIKDEL